MIFTLPCKGRVGAYASWRMRRGGVNFGRRTSTPVVLERHRLGHGRSMNSRVDAFQHPVHIVGDVVIPKTNDAITRGLEPARARLITSDIFADAVLRTINFDDKMRGHACKIGNVQSDRHLSAKVRSLNGEATQSLPQPLLRAGLIQAQTPSGLALKAVDRAFDHIHPRRRASAP